MANETLAIEKHSFSESDRLLVDANVWVYIHGPQEARDRWARIYSGALSRMIKAQSKIFVDVLILSEFVNRYCRIEFGRLPKPSPYKDFKPFRNSIGYPPVAAAIADALRRILKHSKCIGTRLVDIDIVSFLDDFERQSVDFNDRVLVDLCRKQDLTLVTNDGDFKHSGISILTANRRLLS